MDHGNDTPQKRKPMPSSSGHPFSSSSRMRRTSSSVNLRHAPASQPPPQMEEGGPPPPSTSFLQPSRSQRQLPNVRSRGRGSDRSQQNLRLPRNQSTNRISQSEADPPPPSSVQQPLGSASNWDSFDSVSSPVLSLRKGATLRAPRAQPSSQLQSQQGKSHSQLGEASQSSSAHAPWSRRPQTARAVGSFTCPTCGTSLPDRESYKKHLKALDHGHTCETCGAKFPDRGNLNRHVRSVHRKEKPHVCKQCGEGFAFRDGLRRHVDSVHWQIRAFRCASCDKAYKKRDHLRRHLEAFPDHKAANF